MKGCLLLPIRIFADLLRFFFVYPFTKMCPICKHPLSWHSRDAEGRFHD